MQQVFTRPEQGQRRLRRQRGASLVEVLVSMLLFAMAMSGALKLHAAVGEVVGEGRAATQKMFCESSTRATRAALGLPPAAAEDDDDTGC